MFGNKASALSTSALSCRILSLARRERTAMVHITRKSRQQVYRDRVPLQQIHCIQRKVHSCSLCMNAPAFIFQKSLMGFCRTQFSCQKVSFGRSILNGEICAGRRFGRAIKKSGLKLTFRITSAGYAKPRIRRPLPEPGTPHLSFRRKVGTGLTVFRAMLSTS